MTDTVLPLRVLQARAEARALLYAVGEYADFEEATAPLRTYAVESGVVEQVGADAAWSIIAVAFGLVSEETTA